MVPAVAMASSSGWAWKNTIVAITGTLLPPPRDDRPTDQLRIDGPGCSVRSGQRELGGLGQRELAGGGVPPAGPRPFFLVTAKIRSGPNERILLSPGRPPTTSIDSVPLWRLSTWARNRHSAPRMAMPETTTGSPARRPFHASERSRCSEASSAARSAGGRCGTGSVPLLPDHPDAGARTGRPRR